MSTTPVVPTPSTTPPPAPSSDAATNIFDVALSQRQPQAGNIFDVAAAQRQTNQNIFDVAAAQRTAPAPTLWQRLKASVMGPGTFLGTNDPQDTWSNLIHHPIQYTEHAGHFAGELASKPIINASAAMTPEEQQAHPVVAGVADVAGGLTTPTNVGLVAGTAGAGGLVEGLFGKGVAASVSRLAAAGFSGAQIGNILHDAKDYFAAKAKGDSAEAERIMTRGLLGGAIATLGAAHAVTGKVIPIRGNEEMPSPVPAESAPVEPVAAETPQVVAPTEPQRVSPAEPQPSGALPELNPEEHAALEKQAGRPLTTEQAHAMRIRGEQSDILGQMLAGERPSVEDVDSLRRSNGNGAGNGAAKISPRGPVTVEQISQAAGYLGMTPREIFERMPAEGASAEEVVAGSNLLRTKLDSLRPTIESADLSTPEGRAAALRSVNDFLQTQSQVRGKLHSEAGRALRATQIPAASEGNEGFSKAISSLDSLSEDKKSAALVGMQKLLQAGDDAAFSKFASDVQPSSTMDKLHEAWLNSLLSGAAVPKKTFGDFAMTLTTPVEKTLSSGPASAANYVRGMAAGIPDAFTTAWKVFGEDMATLDDVETARGGIKNRPPSIKGTTGRTIRTPGRALAAVSSFFHVLHYDGALWQQAFEQAKSEGLSGDSLSSRAAELRQNPTAQMRDKAYDESSARTYQGKLGEAGEFLAKAPNVGGLRKVIPFARVPLNILKVSTEMSPFGFLKTGIKSAADSEFRGSDAMKAELARNAVGSTFSLWAYYMGQRGLMTGAPVDNTGRDVQDRPAFSVRIGDRWVSYKYATPLAAGLAEGAGAGASARVNPDSPGADLGNAMKSGVEALSGIPLISSINHYFTGLSNAVTDFAAGKNLTPTVAKFGAEQFGSVIPQAAADLGAWTDKYQRAPQNWLDEFKERLPYLREQVAPKLGPNGQPLPGLKNAGGFSPVTVEDVNRDPVIRTMAALHVPLPKPIVNVETEEGLEPVSPAEAQQLESQEDGEFYSAVRDAMSAPQWAQMNQKQQGHALRTIRARITKARAAKLVAMRKQGDSTRTPGLATIGEILKSKGGQ